MPLPGSGIARTFVIVFALVLGIQAFAQTDVDIEKFTNGQDADTAPGPSVLIGSTITWTYVVTNISGRELTNISVTDDQGVVVSCPGTTLDAGLSFTCTAGGTAVAGQYANIGTVTATRSDQAVVTDADPSHYFGQAAFAVSIEKRTNGFDADTPPGPTIAPGSPVNWDYVITNTGNEALANIAVTDDQGVVVSCPSTTLAIGASMTCTGSGIAQAGPYANTGTVTATLAVSNTGVSASDLSHYYGRGLFMVKRTNGIDVAAPPGPAVSPGSTVTWTYEITNPGPETVTGLAVTDDQGVTVSCPQTTLADDETVTCTATGIGQPGQYSNTGTATATLPGGSTVAGSDTSYYFGDEISLHKFTNGADANVPPGPSIVIGTTVNWTYVVTNSSSGPYTSVTVTDDQGVTVTCPDTNLAAGASMTCTASGVATAGQYANIGTVQAQNAALATVTATDPSHYFGVVALPPDVSATKTVVLLTDVDHDGQADPGDTLRYTITITNAGLGDATGVSFSDTPDANTNLVVGSVSATAGTVTSGNTAGNTSVGVNAGTLAANGTAAITFNVTIDNPLAPGVTQVVNSGTVGGSNFPTEVTDDPTVNGDADPTAFALAVDFESVPTLGTWALLTLLAMISVVALRRV